MADLMVNASHTIRTVIHKRKQTMLVVISKASPSSTMMMELCMLKGRIKMAVKMENLSHTLRMEILKRKQYIYKAKKRVLQPSSSKMGC